MSRTYTLADAATVLRAADDDYHDGIDAIVDIHAQPTQQADTAELLVQLTPPDPRTGAGHTTGVARFRVTITPDPDPDPAPDPGPGPGPGWPVLVGPSAPVRPTGLLDGCTDPVVATARAGQIITDRHSGWAAPAGQLLAVLLQAAALDGADLDQVTAWAADLTPDVIGQVDAILTGHTPAGAGHDTTAELLVQRAVLLAHRCAHARVQDSVTATITTALTAHGVTDATGEGAR